MQRIIGFAKLIFCVFVIIAVGAADRAFSAQESPQGFTFQGRLLDAAGTTPLTGPVNLTITVLDKNKQCILYEEDQTGVTLSGGSFSVTVGGGTRTGQSPPAPPAPGGYSLAQVFANDAATLSGLNGTGCGGSYVSSAGDERYLQLTVNGTVLSNPLKVSSVPQALVAETLQGKYPSDFINVNGTVTQANLVTLTNNLDASALHNHDSLYVKVNASNTYNIGASNLYTSTGKLAVGTGVAPTGTSPQLEVLSNSSTNVATLIRGTNTQSADLLQVITNSGTALLSVSSGGATTALSAGAGLESILGDATGSAGKGVVGRANNSGYGVFGTSTNGFGVFGTSATGYSGYFQTSGASSLPTLTARSGTGSGDAQQWVNAGGTALVKIANNGRLIIDPGSDVVPLSISGVAGQTQDLQVIANATGTGLFRVAADGSIYGNGSQLTGVVSVDSTKVAKTGDSMSGTLAVTTTTSSAITAANSHSSTTLTAVNGGSGAAIDGTADSGYGIIGRANTGIAGLFQKTSTDTNPVLVSRQNTTSAANLIEAQNAGGTGLFWISSTGAINISKTTAPAVSASGTGRIYFDTADNKFKMSENGGAYTDIVSTSTVTAVTASSPLASSGGNTPDISLTGRVPLANFASGTSGKPLIGAGAGSDSAYGNLDLANTSGTLSDARLSSNVALKDQANAFTGLNTFSTTQSIILGSNVSGLAIKGNGSQTTALAEFFNSSGTALFTVNPTGAVSNSTDLASKAYVDSQTTSLSFLKLDGTSQMSGTIDSYLGSDVIGLKLRPNGSQTKDLTAWTNTNGTAVLRVNAAGQIIGDGSLLTGTSATDSTKVAKAGGDTIALSTDIAGLAIRASGTQTKNLQEWQNTNGTAVLRVNAAGQIVGDGSLLTGTSATDSTKVSKTGGDTIVSGANITSLAIRNNGTQTADLQNWQNSNGTGVLRVNASGQIIGDGSLLTGTSATDSTKVAKSGDSMTGALAIDVAADVIPLTITGHTTQTSDLLKVIAETGTTVFRVAGDGKVYDNGTTPTATAQLTNKAYVDSQTTSLPYLKLDGTTQMTGTIDSYLGSDVIGLKLRPNGSQTKDLTAWTNTNGTAVLRVNAAGQIIGDGSLLTGTSATDSTKVAKAGGDTIALSTDIAGLAIRASGTQTKNLQEWQNTNGTAVLRVNASGQIIGDGSLLTGTSATDSTKVAKAGGDTIALSTDIAGLAIRASGSQTNSLQEWQNTNGTAVLRVNAAGQIVGDGSQLTGISSTDTTKVSKTGGDTIVSGSNTTSLAIRNNGTQTADLQNWQNSNGTGVLRVNASGQLIGDGSLLTGTSATDSTKVAKSGDSMTGALAIDVAADVIPLTITGHTTQTSDLMKVIAETGTTVFRIAGDGKVYDNGTTPTATAQLTNKAYVDSQITSLPYLKLDGTTQMTGVIDSDLASDVFGLRIRPSASQTKDLSVWTNRNGTATLRVNASGQLIGDGSLLTGTSATDSTKVAKAGGDTIANTTDVVGLAIRANGSQTKDLQQWQNTNGTALTKINSSGQLVGDGSLLTGVSATDSTKVSKTGGDTIVSGANITSLAIRNNGTQTADLQNWQNSNGTGVLRVNASGQLIGDGSLLTGTSATDSTKVAKSGDSMTGALAIDVAADVIPLTITGHTTQTSDLLKVIAETGTTVFRIAGDGKVYDNGTTPTATAQLTNKAYVDSQTTGLPYLKLDGTSQMTGTIDSYLGTDVIGMKIRPNGSQTKDLTAWTNTTGTAVLRVNAAGQIVGDGSQLTGTSATDSTKVAKAGGDTIALSTDVAGLAIRASGSQTKNLQEWQNTTGTAVLRVNSSGQIIGDGSQLTGVSASDSTKVAKAGGDTISLSTDLVGLAIRASGSQTKNLQEWQNTTGTAVLRVNSSGQIIGDGSQLTGVSASDSTKVAKAGGDTIINTSDVVGLAIRANGSQTKDLQQWQNSNGTAIMKINSSGQLVGDGSQLTGMTDSSRVAKTGDSMTGALSIDVGADVIPFTITGHTTQTSDLMKVIAETGTTVFRIAGDGKVYDNGTTPTATAQLTNKAYVDSQTTGLPYLKLDGTSQMTGIIDSDLSSDAIGLKIRPSASQTRDLTAWTNRNGTAVLRVNAAGQLVGDGSQLTGTSATDSTKVAKAGGDTITLGSDITGLAIKASGSQTKNLQEWQNTNGTAVLRVNSSGQIVGDGSQLTGISATDSTKVAKAGGDTIALSTDIAGLAIRASGSQTKNLQEWQNTNGTAILRVNSAGQIVGDGSLLTGLSATDSTKVAKAGGDTITLASDLVGLAIRASGSQTKNLQEWQNTNGTPVVRINSSGQIVGDGSLLTGMSDATKVPLAGGSMTGALSIDVSADIIPFTITGHTTQTSDLMKVIAETGTTVFRIAGDGKVYDNGTTPTATAQLANKAYVDSQTTSLPYLKLDGTTQMSGTIDSYLGSDVLGMKIRPFGTQTKDLTAWTNTNGTAVLRVNASGQIVGDGSQLTGTSATDSTKVSKAGGDTVINTSDVVGIAVRAFGSQTKDLQQWQNSTGTAYVNITSGGVLTASGIASTIAGSYALSGTSTNAAAVYGNSTNNAGVYGVSSSGEGIYGTSLSGSSGMFESNSASNTKPTLLVREKNGSTSDLLQVQNSSGTGLLRLTWNGIMIGNGSQLTGISASDTTKVAKAGDSMTGALSIDTGADSIALSVKGHTTQTNDLMRVISESGTVNFKIDANGATYAVSNYSGATLRGDTPSATGYGVWGNNSGNGGIGVYGLSTNGQGIYGVANTSGDGVKGSSVSGNGVYGSSTSGYSGYFYSVDNTNTVPTLVTRRNGTSTADLFAALNANGTAALRVNYAGQLVGDGSQLTGIAGGSGVSKDGGDTIANTSDVVGLSFKPYSSQTKNLTQWLNSNGTSIMNISSTGELIPGSVGTTPLTIRGLASQTADLTKWYNSSGTAILNVNINGTITGPSITLAPSQSGVLVQSSHVLTTYPIFNISQQWLQGNVELFRTQSWSGTAIIRSIIGDKTYFYNPVVAAQPPGGSAELFHAINSEGTGIFKVDTGATAIGSGTGVTAMKKVKYASINWTVNPAISGGGAAGNSGNLTFNGVTASDVCFATTSDSDIGSSKIWMNVKPGANTVDIGLTNNSGGAILLNTVVTVRVVCIEF